MPGIIDRSPRPKRRQGKHPATAPGAPVPTRSRWQPYWERVAKKALKYPGQRPLSWFAGAWSRSITKTPAEIPTSVHRLIVQKREGGEGTGCALMILKGYSALVEIGAVELHPWNCTWRTLSIPTCSIRS